MIIGIDGNEANADRRVGVHQYAYEILWALFRLNNRSIGADRFIIYLKDAPKNDLPPEDGRWNYRVIKGKNLWVLTKLNKELLFGRKPDVFFTPTHYLPPLTTVPKVCTIHDLGYLNYSEHFKKYDFWQLKYWTAISIIVSKYIITFSEFTKKDIVRHYPFASNKVIVTQHGYDHKRFNNNIASSVVRRVLKKYHIKGNYILFLATLKPSKNIEGLIDAYDKLPPTTKQNYKLVIAGKKGWLYESIFKKTKFLHLEDNIIFTDYISEEDKPALYAGSRVFVNASFWEGFGMQVLEAMACGTPVVVSSVASLPEVVGDVGLYVDPKNSRDIANGLNKILTLNEVKYNNVVAKTVKRAKKFSWEESALGLYKVLLDC